MVPPTTPICDCAYDYEYMVELRRECRAADFEILRLAMALNTIYMTQQQEDSLRQTLHHRQQKCNVVRGEPRAARDAQTLMAQARAAALLADMAKSTRCDKDTMPAFEVLTPYPPSIPSIKDLQSVKLADLRLDTHHHGRMVKLRRIAPVIQQRLSSWSVVQDIEDEDSVERIEVRLHTRHLDLDELDSLSDFILKEPIFTFNESGDPTLRVDHPTDMLPVFPPLHERRPESAELCKAKGNHALKAQRASEARSWYSRGLTTCDKAADSLIKDLYRNRSQANLLLGRFDEALSDATASLVSEENPRFSALNGKAYFRTGCAAYSLQQHNTARTFFEKQLLLTPGDKDANLYLQRIASRVREATTGSYHFEEIRRRLSKKRSRVDVADFPGPTDIKKSPGRGRGLFATRDIAAGDLVMCEKAYCIVWAHEESAQTAMTYDSRDDTIRAFPVGLAQELVEKLRNNPSQAEGVLALYSDWRGVGKKTVITEKGPIIDSFQIYDIVARNAFSPGPQFGEDDARRASAGLWIRASYTNHSCLPNAKNEFIGDLMITRAVKPIQANEEVFFSYDGTQDFEARAASLTRTWGFECTCDLCVAERADGPALREKRQDLSRQADLLVARESPELAGRLATRKAQRLSDAIQQTYNADRYEGLPRWALLSIDAWLAVACGK